MATLIQSLRNVIERRVADLPGDLKKIRLHLAISSNDSYGAGFVK